MDAAAIFVSIVGLGFAVLLVWVAVRSQLWFQKRRLQSPNPEIRKDAVQNIARHCTSEAVLIAAYHVSDASVPVSMAAFETLTVILKRGVRLEPTVIEQVIPVLASQLGVERGWNLRVWSGKAKDALQQLDEAWMCSPSVVQRYLDLLGDLDDRSPYGLEDDVQQILVSVLRSQSTTPEDTRQRILETLLDCLCLGGKARRSASAAQHILATIDGSWTQSGAALGAIPRLIACFAKVGLGPQKAALDAIDSNWTASAHARSAIPVLLACIAGGPGIDLKQREEVTKLLYRIEPESVVQLLTNKSTAARHCAFDVLSNNGWQTRTPKERILWVLNSRWGVIERAQADIAANPKIATPLLCAALKGECGNLLDKDKIDEFRRNVCTFLRDYGDEEAIPTLVGQVHSSGYPRALVDAIMQITKRCADVIVLDDLYTLATLNGIYERRWVGPAYETWERESLDCSQLNNMARAEIEKRQAVSH